MSIEELKLIIDLVQGVSNSVVWVVIVYFGVSILKTTMWLGLITFAVGGLYKLIKHGIDHEGMHSQMQTIMSAAGMYRPFTPTKFDKVVDAVKKAKAADESRTFSDF